MLPDPARPPPGELTHVHPRAAKLWKTANEPSIPEKAQWFGVTPYCMRPLRATFPVSPVVAVGVPATEVVRPLCSITIPPAETASANAICSEAWPVMSMTSVTSSRGSHSTPPLEVTRPASKFPGCPESTGTVADSRVSTPPKYQVCDCPLASWKEVASGVGDEF